MNKTANLRERLEKVAANWKRGLRDLKQLNKIIKRLATGTVPKGKSIAQELTTKRFLEGRIARQGLSESRRFMRLPAAVQEANIRRTTAMGRKLKNPELSRLGEQRNRVYQKLNEQARAEGLHFRD